MDLTRQEAMRLKEEFDRNKRQKKINWNRKNYKGYFCKTCNKEIHGVVGMHKGLGHEVIKHERKAL